MINYISTYTAAPLAPEKLFNVGPFPVTNSMLLGLISAVFVLSVFGLAAKLSKLWPRSRFAFFIESLIEFVYGLMVDAFGDEKKARKHFPLLVSLLIFILVGNLSGLLPGIETIMYNTHGEH